ncbi:MAG: UDP-N-acetylmuramate dehydrogenase [Ottowia sp.]|nr:UDP-N-acetylmuramate dehydrogenase [Ottowia sp.]
MTNDFPLTFHEHYPLASHNSLGFEVSAQLAAYITHEEALPLYLEHPRCIGLPYFILGGGSNIVLTQDFPGLLLKIAIPGKRLLSASEEAWLIEVNAGENWHTLVQWTLKQGWPGLENLALIPGSVGAAPIQNIGAYGSDIAQYCDSVRAYDTHQKKMIELTASACCFAYRDSIFKQTPGRYIITQIRLRLPRNWQPQLHYAELAHALSAIPHPNATQIFDAVVDIRSRKLPDPKILGNVGSFFKNPLIHTALATELKKKYPQLPIYPQSDSKTKLPAAWLIEQCGLKGLRKGPVGVYEKQALVLVHFGGGHGKQLLNLAHEIQAAVYAQFQVTLEAEPIFV